jgi:hypothetical protein
MAKNFTVGEAEELWATAVPAAEYLTRDEFQEVFPLFFDALEDMRYGVRLDESSHFRDFLEYMGLAERDFGWEDFRDWYDAL